LGEVLNKIVAPPFLFHFACSRRHGPVRIMHHRDVTSSQRFQDEIKTPFPPSQNALRLYYIHKEINVGSRNDRCVF
jgi:hypothetical protein